MNTHLMKRSLPWACVLVLASAPASMAAQPEREADEPRTSPPPRRLERAAPEAIRPMAVIGRFLTDDQRFQLRELLGRHRERMLDLEEQLRAARRELHEVLIFGEAEEPAVRRRMAEVVELETARIMQRQRLLRELRPALTPEQRDRLRGWFMGMDFGPGEALGQPREPRARRERAEPRREREFRDDAERRREGSREEREVIRRDERPDRPAVRTERESGLRDRVPEERREGADRAREELRPDRDRPEPVGREESKLGVRPRDGDKDRDHDHN